MMGDFNEIAYPDEKKGGAPVDIRKCQNFNSWINDCNLLEVTTVGTRFTWRGPKWNGRDRVFKKLDRILCNIDWRLKYHEGFAKVLPRVQSDHHPIIVLLKGEAATNRNCPFRFEAAWTSHVDFNNLMNSKWEKDKDIVQSLQELTTHLQKWNKETFGDIFKRKKEILGRLQGIQNSSNYGYSTFLENLKKELQDQLDVTLYQEECLWFQKSRSKWITDGDRNTKYYHSKTIVRRRRNKIISLRNEDMTWVEEPEILRDLVRNFYINLFKEDKEVCDPIISWTTYPTNMEAHHNALSATIQFAECKKALFDMGPLKAPGEDGYPALFFQKCWETVADSLFRMKGNKMFMSIKIDLEKAYDRLNWNFVEICLNEYQVGAQYWKPMRAEASIEQAHCIMHCLDLFCQASGQKINNQKTEIYFSKNVDQQLKEDILQHTCFKHVNNIGKYLGANITHGRATRGKFKNIIDKIQNRLSGWKQQCLSFAGRLTLSKSVLSSIPYYHMQYAKLPKRLCIWDQFQQNIVWQVGDGKKINFWLDKWTPNGTSLFSITNQTSIDSTLLVRDVVLAIPAPKDIDGQDSIGWGGTNNRGFTVKSAYDSHNNSSHPIEGDWKALWSWKGPHRIQTFMWMAAHERLLTNYRRSKWGVGVSPLCSACDKDNETTIHVLRDCPLATQIWIRLVPSNQISNFFSLHCREWIFKNINNQLLGTHNKKWSTIFMVASGCGGLFRNSDGRWIKGYARKIGTCDALSAEMWGMYLGMQLAWRQGFHLLQVESDSKTLVDMITGKVKINGNPPTLVVRIQELLKLNWQVFFNHTWREGNRSAD
ncbi:hypothetical protein TSUD_77850 [Trifolium subterraneum]|uniref:Uncharacterized protein n=1 Tax=Trifolium subterraneum TaxID=3900 RepID=A0A2Z6NDI8_TRISU|nr:hypothetical protein TSUD_77850 [Trifolium subterraneum]